MASYLLLVAPETIRLLQDVREPLVGRNNQARICPMREANPRKPNLPVIWYMQQTFWPGKIRKESKQCRDKLAGWDRPGARESSRWGDGTENIIHEWQLTATWATITHATMLPTKYINKSELNRNSASCVIHFLPSLSLSDWIHWSRANIDSMIQCFTIKIKHLTTLYNICSNELPNIK